MMHGPSYLTLLTAVINKLSTIEEWCKTPKAGDI
jgi:hypothetical protein